MDILVDFTVGEINKLFEDQNTNDAQIEKLKSIQLLKVSNIRSLEKAASTYKGSIIAILDANTPHKKGGKTNDHLVKTNHKITGQHRAVDLIVEHSPGTPITMISSQNRFQRIVTNYYKDNYSFNVNFINKTDLSKIKRNIGYYLRQYLKD